MFGNITPTMLHCGCWYPVRADFGRANRAYLPQVQLESHTTLLADTSRTTLKQTFVNKTTEKLEEVQYTFPLYDGVSVVSFKCTVASKVLLGRVKEKQQARHEYKEAVERGETAGLLEQLHDASDVFTTKVGNVPAGEEVIVEIVYLGELKHDAETDGSRFTIPTQIAPRYGSSSYDASRSLSSSKANESDGIKVTVDVVLDGNTAIRGLQSPSHPIAVTMGRTSNMPEDAFQNHHASATLTLGSAELDKDFVIVVLSKEQGIPRALLETHPTIPNQRALMATLVPKFSLPNIAPEIVFVVDRSDSMERKISTVTSALMIFLKSLPVHGVKFNICSFGSRYSFLFEKSKPYGQSSLEEALQHIKTFDASYGGTELLEPIKASCKNRYEDMALEVMVLTDGQIWDQDAVFNFINEQKNARFFSLGIGHGTSSALVEGIARAGNGFAQFVADNEKMDKRVMRMLKGALSPHITDYTLGVHYVKGDDVDQDFEMVESFPASTRIVAAEPQAAIEKKPISLYDTSAKEESTSTPGGLFDSLPKMKAPKVLQAPHHIPSLFAFNRTTVYLLLSPEASTGTPKSVMLRGTSSHGPLELEIPVQDIGKGRTIHQLAVKKAVHELEQGRGWVTDAKTDDGKSFKEKYESRWDLVVRREIVRLGVGFQVANKYCSFVAVEKKPKNDKTNKEEFEVVTDQTKPTGEAEEESDGDEEDMGFALFDKPSTDTRSSTNELAAYQSSLMTLHQGRRQSGTALFAASLPPQPQPQPQPQRTPGGATPFGVAAGVPAGSAFSIGSGAMGGFGARSTARPPPAQSTGGLFGATPQGQRVNTGGALFGTTAASSQPQSTGSASANSRGVSPFESSSSTGDDDFRALAACRRARFTASMTDEILPLTASLVTTESLPPTKADARSHGPNPGLLSNDDKMRKLIELQNFDGSWDLTDDLLQIIGIKRDTVAAHTVSGLKPGVDGDKVMATLMVKSWLEKRMSSELLVWDMVADKATTWLRQMVDGNVQDVVEEVKTWAAVD